MSSISHSNPGQDFGDSVPHSNHRILDIISQGKTLHGTLFASRRTCACHATLAARKDCFVQ